MPLAFWPAFDTNHAFPNWLLATAAPDGGMEVYASLLNAVWRQVAQAGGLRF